MKQYQKTLLIWLVFGLFIVSVWSFFGQKAVQAVDKPFSEVMTALEKGEVKEVSITGSEFTGELKDGTKFRSTGERNESVMAALNKASQQYQTQYRFEREDVASLSTACPIMVKSG
ncbi:MAG: ATP-dependent metallopeptidase FtsH/Yme1/Tma family protein [Deltaproteobacteria bacterium]|nr:ATP-dependent metallopeptidase FtsH/Yme1/Tma family protein [Deltaproteobacteria bacterium]